MSQDRKEELRALISGLVGADVARGVDTMGPEEVKELLAGLESAEACKALTGYLKKMRIQRKGIWEALA